MLEHLCPNVLTGLYDFNSNVWKNKCEFFVRKWQIYTNTKQGDVVFELLMKLNNNFTCQFNRFDSILILAYTRCPSKIAEKWQQRREKMLKFPSLNCAIRVCSSFFCFSGVVLQINGQFCQFTLKTLSILHANELFDFTLFSSLFLLLFENIQTPTREPKKEKKKYKISPVNEEKK